jgi:glucose-6-phosphate 1-dehydrogenase
MLTRSARLLLLSLFLTCSAASFAKSSVPIIDYQDVPIMVSDGKELSLDEIAMRIRNAAAAHKYKFSASGTTPGQMRLTALVRGKHVVAVDVRFTTKAYSIVYALSENMNFKVKNGKPLIHPNYNSWIQQLKLGIDMAMSRGSQ